MAHTHPTRAQKVPSGLTFSACSMHDLARKALRILSISSNSSGRSCFFSKAVRPANPTNAKIDIELVAKPDLTLTLSPCLQRRLHNTMSSSSSNCQQQAVGASTSTDFSSSSLSPLLLPVILLVKSVKTPRGTGRAPTPQTRAMQIRRPARDR